MKKKLLFITICCLMLITGCISKNKQNNIKESDTNMSNIKVIRMQIKFIRNDK